VLRVRSTALAVALLPAAAAVILWAGRTTGQLGPGPGWDAARWSVTGLAFATSVCAVAVGLVIARGRPAVSPTVPVEERAAPDLHALVRDLAERLEVPAPSAIALTPDCDSWLEDRTHATDERRGASGPVTTAGDSGRGTERSTAPVLVIGSPFLWWMRVAELRALLAPVVAGTGPSAHPDIAAARRFVRGLDAAVANAEQPFDGLEPEYAGGPGATRPAGAEGGAGAAVLLGAVLRVVHRLVGSPARLMLRVAGPHAAAMEQGVAAAAADRAQAVDHGLRVAAQEQVGLAYAGWDRLLTRVALPAWRLGLWPTRLDAGVVSALTELSHRDRLAEGFTSRLGERPACDLLKEPGNVDGAVSLLAARLFLGARPPLPVTAGSGGAAPEWTPVEWSAYPEEVVDRIWRAEAARLFAALDATSSVGTLDPDPDPDHAPGPVSAPTSVPATDPALERTSRPAEGGTSAQLAGGHPAPGPVSAGPAQAQAGAGSRTEEQTVAAESNGSREGAVSRPSVVTASSASTSRLPLHHRQAPQRAQSRPQPRTSDDSVPPEADGRAPAEPGRRAFADGDRSSRDAPAGQTPPAPPASPPPPSPTPPPPGDRADHQFAGPTLARVLDRFTSPGGIDALAACISAEVAREEAASAPGVIGASPGAGPQPGTAGPHLAPLAPMGLPLQPPRGGKELLTDHVTAAVCCAAVDTAGATPGLDWLDGPALYVDGRRAGELAGLVLALVEDGEATGLREWLSATGVRPEKPVRLV
jgi:hypothetical protein